MAVQGLLIPGQEINAPKFTPSNERSDEVGVVVEALDMLGVVVDHDQATESVASEFAVLDELGVEGQKYVGGNVFTFDRILEVLDGGKFPAKTYPNTFVNEEPWFDVKGKGSVLPPHARLAVHNPDNPISPLLHGLGLPYDGTHEHHPCVTQVDFVTEKKTAFESERWGFNLSALTHMDIAFIALIQRIKGENMPLLGPGYMRDASLPRANSHGRTLQIGSLTSTETGQLRFSGSGGLGFASEYWGVGLSLGKNQTL